MKKPKLNVTDCLLIIDALKGHDFTLETFKVDILCYFPKKGRPKGFVNKIETLNDRSTYYLYKKIQEYFQVEVSNPKERLIEIGLLAPKCSMDGNRYLCWDVCN